MSNEKYIPLGLVAQETGLPKALLKRYTSEGKIPALKTPKQMLFRLSAVKAALEGIENQNCRRGARA